MTKLIPLILALSLITSCTNNNRYQLVVDSDINGNQTTLLVDKKTGTIWERVTIKDHDNIYVDIWLNTGTPPKEVP